MTWCMTRFLKVSQADKYTLPPTTTILFSLTVHEIVNVQKKFAQKADSYHLWLPFLTTIHNNHNDDEVRNDYGEKDEVIFMLSSRRLVIPTSTCRRRVGG